MRYLTLDEAMKIAEDVTGIDMDTLARVSRLELLDSALHTPSSGFGEKAGMGFGSHFSSHKRFRLELHA